MHPSALLDYRFVIINHAVNAVLFGALVISTVTTTDLSMALLHLALGQNSVSATPGPLASLGFTACLLLAVDGGLFLAHWLVQHKVPVLWEFHKVHHSAEVLTPVTDLRMHPVDTILSILIQTCLVGAANAMFLYLYADPVAEVTVIERQTFSALFCIWQAITSNTRTYGFFIRGGSASTSAVQRSISYTTAQTRSTSTRTSHASLRSGIASPARFTSRRARRSWSSVWRRRTRGS